MYTHSDKVGMASSSDSKPTSIFDFKFHMHQNACDDLEGDLARAVTQFLRPHMLELGPEFRVLRNGRGFDVRGQAGNSPNALILCVSIQDEYRQICIPNIINPQSLKNRGIGKALIALVHHTAKSYGYNTFVTELTQGFFQRLKRRGALVIDDEVVQITDQTRLD